jgi:hypothetical protein
MCQHKTMNKQLILSIIIFLLGNPSRAQSLIDTIFTKENDTLVCHITLVNSNNVFYTYHKNKSTYISLKKVNRFVLNSKDVEVLNELPKKDSVSINSAGEALYLKGKQDALKYYGDYIHAGTGTLVISLLSPLAGLVPAIACGNTEPKEKNLNYHDAELIKNSDYHKGYVQSAWKIKQHKVWTNWKIALAVNIGAALLILTNDNRF